MHAKCYCFLVTQEVDLDHRSITADDTQLGQVQGHPVLMVQGQGHGDVIDRGEVRGHVIEGSIHIE